MARRLALAAALACAARGAVVRHRERIGPRADTLVVRSPEGYLLGEVPLFAILDAQRAALAAEERYATTLRDYYFRLAELERFIGRRFVFPGAASTAHHADSLSP